MITARINAKGAIAAPGVAQVLGRTLTLRKAAPSGVDLELDFSGYAGGRDATCSVMAAQGLSVSDHGASDGVWSLTLSGAGVAALTIIPPAGPVWSGRVVVQA